MRAALCAAEPGQRFGKLDLAVAVDAGHAEDLAAAYLESQRPKARAPITLRTDSRTSPGVHGETVRAAP